MRPPKKFENAMAILKLLLISIPVLAVMLFACAQTPDLCLSEGEGGGNHGIPICKEDK